MFVAERTCGCPSQDEAHKYYVELKDTMACAEKAYYSWDSIQVKLTYTFQGVEISQFMYIDGSTCDEMGYLTRTMGTICVPCNEKYDNATSRRCSCTLDSALSVDGWKCVVPGQTPGCDLRAPDRNNLGTWACVPAPTCVDYYSELRLSEDGITCVTSCENTWFERVEETGELRCVEKCTPWWY